VSDSYLWKDSFRYTCEHCVIWENFPWIGAKFAGKVIFGKFFPFLNRHSAQDWWFRKITITRHFVVKDTFQCNWCWIKYSPRSIGCHGSNASTACWSFMKSETLRNSILKRSNPISFQTYCRFLHFCFNFKPHLVAGSGSSSSGSSDSSDDEAQKTKAGSSDCVAATVFLSWRWPRSRDRRYFVASPRQFFFLGADRDRATVAISLRCAVLVARKTRVPVCLAAVAIFLPLAKRNTSSSFNRSFLVFPQRARRRPSEQLAVRRSQWQEKSPFRRNLARKTLKWQSSTRWGAVADQRLVAVIKRPFSYLSFYLLQG